MVKLKICYEFPELPVENLPCKGNRGENKVSCCKDCGNSQYHYEESSDEGEWSCYRSKHDYSHYYRKIVNSQEEVGFCGNCPQFYHRYNICKCNYNGHKLNLSKVYNSVWECCHLHEKTDDCLHCKYMEIYDKEEYYCKDLKKHIDIVFINNRILPVSCEIRKNNRIVGDNK